MKINSSLIKQAFARRRLGEPSPNQVASAKVNVFNHLKSSGSFDMQPISSKSPLFIYSFVQGGVSLAIIIALVVVTLRLDQKLNTVSNQVKEVSVTGGNTIMAVNMDPNKYFIPSYNPDGSTNSNGSIAISASPTSANSSANPDLLAIDVDPDLRQYITNGKNNLVIGLRDEAVTASRSLFIEKAEAAKGKYPVLYYRDWNKIIELNIVNGTRRTVVDIGTKMFSGMAALSFNQKRQILTYVTVDKSGFDGRDEVVNLNLNTGKSDAIMQKHIGNGADIGWSPDGRYFATSEMIVGDIMVGQSIWVYDAETKITKVIDTFSDVQKRSFNGGGSRWTEDSVGLIGKVPRNGGTTAEDAHYLMPCTLNIASEALQCITDPINTTNDNSNISQLNGKLYSMTNDGKFVAGNLPKPNGGSYGWISIYNLTSKSFKEYRDQTGDYLKQWIISKTGDKVVYTKETGKESEGTYAIKLGVLNVATGVADDLPLPEKPTGAAYYNFVVVGWNGNEDNVIIFDTWSRFWNVNLTTKVITEIAPK